MTTYDASIEIHSETLSLADLASLLGLAPSDESHDRGTPRAGGGTWNATIWRVNSQVGESASLEEHCADALARALASGLFGRGAGSVPEGVRVVLNVTVFFYTACCTVSLPPSCLRAVRSYPLEVEVSCYPSSDGAGDG